MYICNYWCIFVCRFPMGLAQLQRHVCWFSIESVDYVSKYTLIRPVAFRVNAFDVEDGSLIGASR